MFGNSVVGASGGGLPEPAHAQLGIFIPRIGGFNFYGGGRGCRHCRGGRHSGDDDAGNDDSGSRKDRNDRTDIVGAASEQASKTRCSGSRRRSSIRTTQVTGIDAGTSKSISPLGKAVSKEGERDWTEEVQKISTNSNNIRTGKAGASRPPGDVTEHAIEQSLENAMRNAKLNTFENFLGRTGRMSACAQWCSSWFRPTSTALSTATAAVTPRCRTSTN